MNYDFIVMDLGINPGTSFIMKQLYLISKIKFDKFRVYLISNTYSISHSGFVQFLNLNITVS